MHDTSFDPFTFFLVSVLKINDVEGELVRPDIIRDGLMLRDQIAQQAQKIAPSPLQLKIASALSRDKEYFPSLALDPHHKGRHPCGSEFTRLNDGTSGSSEHAAVM